MKTQRTQLTGVTACGAEEKMVDSKETNQHHVFVPHFADPGDEEKAVAETRDLAESKKLNLVISEWLGNTRAMQDLIHLAQENGMPAVFVHATRESKIGRIVVATGGGPNQYEQMWLARKVSARNAIPVAILHWTGSLDLVTKDEIAENKRHEKRCLRLLSIQEEFLQCSGDDFASAVAGSLRPDDLLVIGATSPFRLVPNFAGSLPDQLAKVIPNPLIMLSGPLRGRIGLRLRLWGQMLKPRLRSRSKAEAHPAGIRPPHLGISPVAKK